MKAAYLTERVDGSQLTKPFRPAKSSRLSQMHRTEMCQETLRRKRTPLLEPNGQHLQGQQMEQGKNRSKMTPISPGSSGNTCLTPSLAIVSIACSNSSGF